MTHVDRMLLRGVTLLTFVVVLAAGREASAFTHVVTKGETLAQIAERMYGSSRFEVLLVGANALDARGGGAIQVGMRLEIPAPRFHVVVQGETWADLASTWLGHPDRADAIAKANKTVPWSNLVPGREIAIPYVLTYVANEGDEVANVTRRFLGDPAHAWEVNRFNGRGGQPLARGEVLLVPILDLKLTDAGKAEARQAIDRERDEGRGAAHDSQMRADTEVPLLRTDVREGRFVEAVARGNRLLAGGPLTKPQLAETWRALVHAYVALDVDAAASAACREWRANDAALDLDPARVSPKVRAACAKATPR
ncbi:MAG: LysM domain-containing protein [Polyangiaceae bacterium]